jgi:Rrf2 family protein
MSVNTQLTVAVHVLCLLAGGDGQPMTSEWIASSVGTNPVVIRRVLGKLRIAGLVRSRGGAKGGWELLEPPARISLRRVLEATAPGPLLALHRDSPNPNCEIGGGVQRALKQFYGAAEEALRAKLGGVSITEVLESIRRRPPLP